MKPSYAFVGLGHLGGALAACLVREGFEVHVYDRDAAGDEMMLAT